MLPHSEIGGGVKSRWTFAQNGRRDKPVVWQAHDDGLPGDDHDYEGDGDDGDDDVVLPAAEWDQVSRLLDLTWQLLILQNLTWCWDTVRVTFVALQAKYAFVQNILMPLSDRLNKDNEW